MCSTCCPYPCRLQHLLNLCRVLLLKKFALHNQSPVNLSSSIFLLPLSSWWKRSSMVPFVSVSPITVLWTVQLDTAANLSHLQTALDGSIYQKVVNARLLFLCSNFRHLLQCISSEITPRLSLKKILVGDRTFQIAQISRGVELLAEGHCRRMEERKFLMHADRSCSAHRRPQSFGLFNPFKHHFVSTLYLRGVMGELLWLHSNSSITLKMFQIISIWVPEFLLYIHVCKYAYISQSIQLSASVVMKGKQNKWKLESH